MKTTNVEPKQTQIDAVKELIENGTIVKVLRCIDMKDKDRLIITGVLFDYAETEVFSEKVLQYEYTDEDLIEHIKYKTEISIDDLIRAYKLDKQEKRELICDFLGVNHLATNEELSNLIREL